MIIGEKRCGNCAYARKEGEAALLLCAFKPPTAFPLPRQGPQGSMAITWISGFPPVHPDLVCGQHKSRLVAAAAT